MLRNPIASLFSAVENNDLNTLKTLIESEVSLDYVDRQGWTALHYAAVLGHVDCVVTLINAGAAVDAQNQVGATPLILATKKNNIEVVGELLNAGAHPDLATYLDATPASIAAIYGRTEILRLLAMAGLDLSVPTRQGDSLSILAEKQGHEETAEYLCLYSSNRKRTKTAEKKAITKTELITLISAMAQNSATASPCGHTESYVCARHATLWRERQSRSVTPSSSASSVRAAHEVSGTLKF